MSEKQQEKHNTQTETTFCVTQNFGPVADDGDGREMTGKKDKMRRSRKYANLVELTLVSRFYNKENTILKQRLPSVSPKTLVLLLTMAMEER